MKLTKVIPALYSTNVGTSWSWYSLAELTGIVNERLGTSLTQSNVAECFMRLSALGVSGSNQAGLLECCVGDHPEIILKHSTRSGTFALPNLFVPAGWGNDVLSCAKAGICRTELSNVTLVSGTGARVSSIDEQNYLHIGKPPGTIRMIELGENHWGFVIGFNVKGTILWETPLVLPKHRWIQRLPKE